VLLAGLAGTFLYLRSAYPPERLLALLEPRVEAALGRDVEIGAAQLVPFPLAVRLDAVRVAAAPGSTAAPLLEIGSIRFELRLLPLLRREVRVRTLVLDSPRVILEQNAAKHWNFARSGPEAAPKAGAGHAADGPRLALAVESLEIRSGEVSVWSAPQEIGLRLPVNSELRFEADREWRDVRVSGWIESDGITGGDRGRLAKLHGLRLRLEPALAANVAEHSATIEKLRVTLMGLVVDLAGRGALVDGRPVVHLESRTEELDLAALQSLVPPEVAPQLQSVRAAGKGKLELQVDLPQTGRMDLRGSFQMQGGSLQSERWPAGVQDIRADLRFAGDSLEVENLEARIAGSPLRIRGSAHRGVPPAPPAYDLRLETTLDLAKALPLLPKPPPADIRGRAQADLRARGSLGSRALPRFEGPITLADVQVTAPALRQPLGIEARLLAQGDVVRIENAELRLGGQEVTVDGTLHPALPPELPAVSLQARADKLDLDAALPPESAPGGAAAKPGSPAAAPPTLLPPLPKAKLDVALRAGAVQVRKSAWRDVNLDFHSQPQGFDLGLRAASFEQDKLRLQDLQGRLAGAPPSASGRLQARAGKLGKIEASNLAGDLRVAGNRIELANVAGRAYDGNLKGKLAVDLDKPDQPKQQLDLEVEEVQLAGLLGEITQAAGFISGSLSATSSFKSQGAGEALRNRLTASGQGVALNGQLRGSPLLTSLAQILHLESLQNLRYRDLGFAFQVQEGRIQIPRLQVRATDMDLGLLGNVGLDGSLDLGLNVQLSEEVSKRYARGQIGSALGTLFANPEGRLVLDFKVGGNLRQPALRPDLEKTTGRAGMQSLAKLGLERFLGKNVGPAPAADSLETKANENTKATPEDLPQRAVREAIRGLLGGRKKAAVDSTKKAAPDSSRKP